MPTLNDLYDPEADAVHDADTRIADVIPELPRAGGDISAGRPSPSAVEGGGQASKGVVRRFGRFLIEPALIAGAGVAGALMEFHYARLPGDNPVIGTAATAASVVITVGAIRLLTKEGSRGGWRVVGGLVIRCVLVLLCIAIELHGYSSRSWCCMPADMSQAERLPAITFE